MKKAGGQGKPVVFLHGFGSDSQSWVGNTPALFDTFEVWCIDLPGHGQSSAIAPVAGIESLAVQLSACVFADERPVHLVGHSLGGALAMALVVLQPARVASLTLLAPAGLGASLNADFLNRFPALSTEADTHAALLMLVHKPQFISPMFAPLVLGQLNRSGVRDSLRSIADTIINGQHELADIVREVSQSDLPRLVIWGQQDRINPLAETAAGVFGGQWQVIEQCGHLPQIEHRTSCNKWLVEFLNSH